MKRKPTSHVKLPKIDKNMIGSSRKLSSNEFIDVKQSITQGQSPQIENISLHRSQSINLKPISMTTKTTNIINKLEDSSKTSKTQNNEKLSQRVNLIDKNDKNLEQKQKVVPNTTGNTQFQSDSASLFQGSLHPVILAIQALLSDEVRDLIVPVKVYSQASLGQVSCVWWAVTDSLILSLQKLLKLKPVQAPSPSTSKSPSVQNTKKAPSYQIESNTKATIQISKIYSFLEQQTKTYQQQILRYYQDPTHQALILQAFFFQKAILYLLASIRKWNHPAQHIQIHSMSIQLLPCISECRKLIMEIHLEAVENQQQDNKIRKPKYIARQKKLIQISKFLAIVKTQFEKCLGLLGELHRYRVFRPGGVKDYEGLAIIEQRWRNIVFDTPVAPYLPDRPTRKQYLLVLQPLNLLYRYNKKYQCLQISPEAQSFLQALSTKLDIILFTHLDKDSCLLKFLGILEKAQILGVLDRKYLSYLQAKPVKDISKLGGGYLPAQVLVLDDCRNMRFYSGVTANVHYFQATNHDARVVRVKAKPVRVHQSQEGYLGGLAQRILGAVQNGTWEGVLNGADQPDRDTKFTI